MFYEGLRLWEVVLLTKLSGAVIPGWSAKEKPSRAWVGGGGGGGRGSICPVLRGAEALGGSFVYVLHAGEALGGSGV